LDHFLIYRSNYEQALQAAHRRKLPDGMGDSDYVGEEDGKSRRQG